MTCFDCNDTHICQHCHGDGHDPDGPPWSTCPLCDGDCTCQFCADFSPSPSPEEGPEEKVSLGPCCACGHEGPEVRNIMMLNRLCPIPGRGWGCVQCGIPMDYATAVLYLNDLSEDFICLRLFRLPNKKHPHGQEARFCPDCVPAVLKYILKEPTNGTTP